MRSIHNRQNGFTIIELLVASAVFSTILLVCAAGVVYIGNLFYKGITSNATQEVARSTIDEIRNDFELSGGNYKRLVALPGPIEGFCIGSHLYSYIKDQKINNTSTNHAFVVRDRPGCDTDPTAQPDNVNGPANPLWHEFLGPNMRLQNDPIASLPPKPESVNISINVISADDALINATGTCRGDAGSQFCASSRLSTYAVRRIQ